MYKSKPALLLHSLQNALPQRSEGIVKLFSSLVKKPVDLMRSNHGLPPCMLALTTLVILIEDRNDTLLTESRSPQRTVAMTQCRQEFSRLTPAATNQTRFGTQCDTPRQRSGLELECMNIRSNLANNGKGPRISSEGAKD